MICSHLDIGIIVVRYQFCFLSGVRIGVGAYDLLVDLSMANGNFNAMTPFITYTKQLCGMKYAERTLREPHFYTARYPHKNLEYLLCLEFHYNGHYFFAATFITNIMICFIMIVDSVKILLSIANVYCAQLSHIIPTPNQSLG